MTTTTLSPIDFISSGASALGPGLETVLGGVVVLVVVVLVVRLLYSVFRRGRI